MPTLFYVRSVYCKIIAACIDQSKLQAFYLGWLPPRYVWFTYSWYNNGWWDENNGNSSCTPEMIRRMLNGSVAITPNNNLVSDDKDMVTISGLVSEVAVASS